MRATLTGVIAASLLILARAAVAQTADPRPSCLAGSRFAPGPIVDGHHRQPTQREVETRLKELSKRSRTCMASPGSLHAEARGLP